MRRRLLLPLLLFLPACIREPERPPPPPPPPPAAAAAIQEENLQPDPIIRLEIIDLHDTRDEKTNRVTVTGTLINRGTKPTSQVNVKLTALDEQGLMIVSVAAVPSTDRIAADGGTAKFSAEIDYIPAIRTFHVEALAR